MVDPSEYAPKVVPYCEVEGALGRGGEEGGEGMEGGGEEVAMAVEEKDNSISEVRCYIVSPPSLFPCPPHSLPSSLFPSSLFPSSSQ